MNAQTKLAGTSKRFRKMARKPKVVVDDNRDETAGSQLVTSQDATASVAPVPKPPTKAQFLLGLLRRDEGATLEQLVAATGWLPHTTRAALTGIKRKGHTLNSVKVDGVRIYRVAAGTPYILIVTVENRIAGLEQMSAVELTPGSVNERNVESVIGTKVIKNEQMCISVDYARTSDGPNQALRGRDEAQLRRRACHRARGPPTAPVDPYRSRANGGYVKGALRGP